MLNHAGQPDAGETAPPVAPAPDTTIVRAAIHPAIGVARVGNSPEGWFPGPEVIPPPVQPPGYYRDDEKALKREVARFRLYGYNAAGEVVRELTPDEAAIRWTVHVANRKAAWYQWQIALDIPEAEGAELPLRNAAVTGAARVGLVIDSGPVSILGKSTRGEEYALQGAFQGTGVNLGELRTDADGRLLVFPGPGVSASPTGSPIYDESDPNAFINANGWYDDVCDGPVSAEVSLGDRQIPVTSAWVLSAPPNYAPQVLGVRTLYDLLYDLFIQAGWLSFPAVVSFRRDVYPILERLCNLQWVNKGYAAQYGRGGPQDFQDPDYLTKLAAKPAPGQFDTYGELRRQVLNSFRSPEGADSNQLPWPWVYGDAMAIPPADTPRQNATVSPTQYRVLQLWAAGQFEADWENAAPLPQRIEEVPLAEQPGMLDRAALEFCLADAFHPGCEVTWPIRHLSMFSAPFRVQERPAGTPEPDYGPTLTPEIALSANGPLHAQGPGDLTRWMGLPWQADTAYCRSGYDTTYDPYVPTFWPARVPNQILTPDNYAVVRNPYAPREQRLAAYSARMVWTDPLKRPTVAEQMERMVAIYGDMGLVEVREGVPEDPELPPVMMVASFGNEIPVPPPPGTEAAEAPLDFAVGAEPEPEAEVPLKGASAGELLRRRAREEAGWDSREEVEKAPLPVRHPKKRGE